MSEEIEFFSNHIIKKGLNGSKCDYWDILNITTNLFYHHLSGTEETINYKKFRVWFRNDLLYIKSFEADKTINGFLHVHKNRQD
jgi:hypothetical protein